MFTSARVYSRGLFSNVEGLLRDFAVVNLHVCLQVFSLIFLNKDLSINQSINQSTGIYNDIQDI